MPSFCTARITKSVGWFRRSHRTKTLRKWSAASKDLCLWFFSCSSHRDTDPQAYIKLLPLRQVLHWAVSMGTQHLTGLPWCEATVLLLWPHSAVTGVSLLLVPARGRMYFQIICTISPGTFTSLWLPTPSHPLPCFLYPLLPLGGAEHVYGCEGESQWEGQP